MHAPMQTHTNAPKKKIMTTHIALAMVLDEHVSWQPLA